jgi:hypothetical protein
MQPRSPVPARPPRDTRVDIVRGWLQLTIFASHAAGSWIGAWLIHGAWGLSDSSEQFVFLSGLMLGSVFALKTIRQGWRTASLDMLVRSWRLYRTNMIVFALFGALAVLAGRSGLWPGETERLGWSYVLQQPVQALLAGLTTFYQPSYMDILPVFFWCMLALPLFAALEAKVGDWALVVPFTLYAAVQFTGLAPPILGTGTKTGFNPFAWQVLFLVGAWLGRRSLLFGRALPRFRWLTWLAIAILALGLLFRLSWFGFLSFTLPVAEDDWVIGKDALALPRVLHAFALAWLVAIWVPRNARWMRGAAMRWLAAAGRHSLQVFCLGLFLSWGVTAAFRLWPAAWWLDPVLMVVGCAVLLLFALWLDRGRAGVASTGRQTDASRAILPRPAA